MIKPSLHIKILFRTQVQKCLSCYFSIETMKNIRYCMLEKNTSVMELILIYETFETAIRKLYRVLSCVVYTIIDNYGCIEYLSCQSKKIMRHFKEYNI